MISYYTIIKQKYFLCYVIDYEGYQYPSCVKIDFEKNNKIIRSVYPNRIINNYVLPNIISQIVKKFILKSINHFPTFEIQANIKKCGYYSTHYTLRNNNNNSCVKIVCQIIIYRVFDVLKPLVMYSFEHWVTLVYSTTSAIYTKYFPIEDFNILQIKEQLLTELSELE